MFAFARRRLIAAPIAVAVLLGLNACGTDEMHENYPPAAAPVGPSVDWAAPDLDAARAFDDFEHRLTDFGPVGAKFEVRSSEPVPCKMHGVMRLEYAQKVHLEAEGRMNGKDVSPAITSNEERSEGGTRQKSFETETPAGLRASVAIGLSRMGILHNLVRLSGGALPDHADGDVRSWVTVQNVRAGAIEKTPKGDVRALSFDILVGGQMKGDATLLFDIHTGWPVRRVQTVRFPEGTMTVEETYTFF